MRTETDRKSFVLKPSTLPESGIGVFILHDVAEGSHLELILDDFEEELCDPADLPEELRGFCIDQPDGKALCPVRFNRLDIGNYLNHSVEKQNIRYQESGKFFALRDLKKGEELFANYNELGEPEEAKEDYYQL
jgi:hypothetical protein